MAKIIRKSGSSRDEYPLTEAALTIGRRADNHIVLPDTFASGRHAMIGYVNGRYFIEDLKSSNGTVLNGQRVAKASLKHGDVIYIGQQRLEFFDADATATMAFENGATMMMPAGAMPKPVPPPPAPPPAPVAPPVVAVPPSPPAAAAAKPAANLPQSPLPGFNFILPDIEVPKPMEQAPNPAALDPLEGMARSIRSHREHERQEKEGNEARLRAEWDRVVQYATNLQGRFKDDARIKYFNVSQRSGEISLRVQSDPQARLMSIVLTREHPDHKTGNVTGIWLRMTGDADVCHPTADAALAELARAIAFLFV
ncbi:MAG TPA: FHA domain-containing protein [Solimonas sp.]|nr:FHA domain-containing protein [Solimonas sp.]